MANNKQKILSELADYSNGKINRLKKNIDDEIKKNLHKFGKATADKLKEYTMMWYQGYEPLDYERTMNLIDSISYTVHKNNKITIKFDMRKFQTRKVNDGIGWQPHRGFDEAKFTWGLIDWIENGGNGGTKANPRRGDGGIGMLQNTVIKTI